MTADRLSPQLTALRGALSELFAAERRLRGREKRTAGELTLTQSIALIRIGRDGPTSAGEFADAAGLNPASVTAMLDQLERSGVVKRTRSAADGRVVLISLTEDGQRRLDEVRARWDALWAARFADVPEADLLTALEVLRRIAAMMDDA